MKIRHKSLPRERRITEPEVRVSLNELIQDISSTRDKIEEELGKLDTHMAEAIKARLTKFVALQTSILESKDQQLAEMKEHYEKIRMSQLNENIVRLEKKIQHLQQEVQRINTVKDMYRKESDRLKIDLEIKEKELVMCNKREKQLIRHVWVLEEDIKDLYEAQTDSFQQGPPIRSNLGPKTPLNTPLRTRYKPQAAAVTHTEPSSNSRLDSSCSSGIPSMIENKYLSFKQSGVTKLREKFGASLTRAKPIAVKSKPKLHLHAPSMSQHLIETPQHVDQALYEEVKERLRKETQRDRYQQTQRQDQSSLTIQKFRLICLHGLRIMKQIEKVVLDHWGSLQQIDEYSLGILDALFRSQRAVKIMEIVLFSYSQEALNQIKNKAQMLVVENHYDLPALDNIPKPLPGRHSTRRNFQQELIKKFKNPQRLKNKDARRSP